MGIHHNQNIGCLSIMTPLKMSQKKKSHLLFSFLVRIVLFLHFIGGILFVKNIITSFHWCHLNNYTSYENKCFIVGFFIPVSSLEVFGHSIHSERRRICLGKSIQALQNDTISYHIMTIQFRGHPANRAVAYLKKTFMLVFINSCPLQKLSRQLLIRVPDQSRTHVAFSHKVQAKTFTWPDMSFYA